MKRTLAGKCDRETQARVPSEQPEAPRLLSLPSELCGCSFPTFGMCPANKDFAGSVLAVAKIHPCVVLVPAPVPFPARGGTSPSFLPRPTPTNPVCHLCQSREGHFLSGFLRFPPLPSLCLDLFIIYWSFMAFSEELHHPWRGMRCLTLLQQKQGEGVFFWDGLTGAAGSRHRSLGLRVLSTRRRLRGSRYSLGFNSS